MKCFFTLLLISSFLHSLLFAQSIAGTEGESFLDLRDSVSYTTIEIGKQVWMGENLHIYTPGSDCFDHDTTNCMKYGRLYTYDQAISVCPEGWRLPSQTDWDILIDIAGGASLAGGMLKTGGISNFNIRIAGIRKKLEFIDYKETTGFWSATVEKETDAFIVLFFRSKPKAKAGFVVSEDYRLSVRCIKE